MNLLKKNYDSFISLLIGIFSFLFITGGGKIVNPTFVNWLYEGDSTTHWLGWQFFRYSPIFQWPLGSNTSYGMEIGSSIVFSDSVTLFAFIFKLFNFFLPDQFQYSGIWILTCFILQAFFSWKLLSLFTYDKYLRICGCVFFVISPIFLWRLQYHYALSAHWIILASFYFYFKQKYSRFNWVLLLSISPLIEPYILAMVLPIFFADLIQRKIQSRISNRTLLSDSMIICLILIAVMWSAGYFMLGNSVGASGFGHLRANLLTFVDPDDIWSTLLPNLSGGSGDYEGFGFLGLGMIILGIVAFLSILFSRIIVPQNYYPIAIVIICFFIFSISNKISFGIIQIVSIEIPFFLKKITETFRTSGRFIWPVIYFIYLLIFIKVFRFKRIISISLLVFLIILQINDSKNAILHLNKKFANSPLWISPLQNQLWDSFSKKYTNVIWINLPRNSKVKWFPLCEYAAINKMKINHGYFGRYDHNKIAESAKKMENDIINYSIGTNSLYVFEDEILWFEVLKKVKPSDLVIEIDGYKVLAPNFFNKT